MSEGWLGPHQFAHHSPPHPGEFLQELYLEAGNISIRELAGRLSPDMALRLSRVVGRSAESWLALQDHHDLWSKREQPDLSGRLGPFAQDGQVGGNSSLGGQPGGEIDRVLEVEEGVR